MPYTVVFLSLARDDKVKIKSYLKQFYPSTPKKFITALKDRISALRDSPYMCPIYTHNPAYRKMVVAKYLVFYKVNDERKTIEIHRILPGSWDIARHIS
jgi:plasmid stabilization system protein ParE